ncbi:hypothetical protein ACFQJC_02890 [Haloferax namakaokahaiae]|uniref:Uncharacterized protein n=1 Tax=Haloferax namakaokahaiae TaxID=1748331 RepID=A0ABD5ZBG0_9EURY
MERKRATGGIVAFIGFILSPLSWWNDLVVNLPLAYVFGVLVAFFVPTWFLPGIIVGYWLTNVIGFIMLHKGALVAATGEDPETTPRALARDVGISIGYTALVVVLVWYGVLVVPEEMLRAIQDMVSP